MRKRFKEALKRYGYKMIKPSWYRGKANDNTYLFNAYDDCGICHQFFVDAANRYARRGMMTTSDIKLEDSDVAYMFFD